MQSIHYDHQEFVTSTLSVNPAHRHAEVLGDVWTVVRQSASQSWHRAAGEAETARVRTGGGVGGGAVSLPEYRGDREDRRRETLLLIVLLIVHLIVHLAVDTGHGSSICGHRTRQRTCTPLYRVECSLTARN